MNSLIKLFLCALFLFSLSRPSGAQTSSPPDSSSSEISPADKLWKDARSCLDARDYRTAQEKYEEFIRNFLSDERVQEARVYSAICDYRQKRVVKALDSWSRVANMELMQKRASSALLLALDQFASHYRVDGKTGEWEKIVDQLAEFFPDNPATLRELRFFALQNLNKGEFFQAVAAYERFQKQLNAQDLRNLDLARAMTESGADGYAIVKSANAQLEGNNPELAARLYTEALKKNLRDDEKFEAMTKLGWCLYLRNREKESEKLWKEVVASAPKGNEWRGKSRWHLVVLNAGDHNDTKKAIELCEEQADEFKSGFLHGQALFSKAWLLWAKGRWRESKEAFDVLISEFPEKATHPPIMKYIEDCEHGMSARM